MRRLLAIAERQRQPLAQLLIHQRRRDRDAENAAEAAEQVRARGRDGLVGVARVRNEADERRRHADAVRESADDEAEDDAEGGVDEGTRKREDQGGADDEARVGEDGEPVEAAGPLHVEAAEEAARDARDDAGDETDAGGGGGGAVDDLEVEGEVEDGGHVAGKGEEVAQVAGDERALEDDVAGREGLGGDLDLDEEEGEEERDGDGEGDDGEPVAPGHVGAAVEAEQEHEDG